MTKVEVKTEDTETCSSGEGTTMSSTNMAAIKRHTIDAILGLPRLACMQNSQDHQGKVLYFTKINLLYDTNIVHKIKRQEKNINIG